MRKLAFILLLVSSVLMSFGQKKLSEKDMRAYLMVYHTDDTHGLHVAISPDGYTFTALNNGNPFIAGDTIAQQKGIRDPHIYRGPDGAFYLAMTDLHIFAKRDGLRDTEWERDGEKYGWGNNRGFVLMKSFDLIHWTRSNVIIEDLFPDLEVSCAWAPETIYDPEVGKMMLYFTMRLGDGKSRTKMYYAYTDDDFTTLTTKPELIFEYPDTTKQVLDADITPLPDGRYCMMYCAQDGTAGIKMAFSDKINRDYVYLPDQIDFEKYGCEGPNVFKRIGESKWVLLYDIYGIRPHNFGFAETTDFKTFTHIGHFDEGVMKRTNFSNQKHGAVIQITQEEYERLKKYCK